MFQKEKLEPQFCVPYHYFQFGILPELLKNAILSISFLDVFHCTVLVSKIDIWKDFGKIVPSTIQL